MNNSYDYIKLLLPDYELTNEDCSFLHEYISAWLTDEEIDVNAKTIRLLNKNRDAIDLLKNQYASDKIMNVTERMITLSQIAAGQVYITEYARTKDGPMPYQREPSFNERIAAINALGTLEQIANINTLGDKKIIIDDIPMSPGDNIEVTNEETK